MQPAHWIPALTAFAAGGAAHLTGAAPFWAAAAAGVAAGLASWTVGRMAAEPARDRQTAAPASPPAEAPPGPDTLIEALPVGVILVDSDRTIRLLNGAAGDICGPRVGADQNVSTLRVPALLELVEAAFAGLPAQEADLAISRGATDRHVHVRASRVGAGGSDVLVTLEDITRQRIANDLHRDFVANASHELKTPLAAVSGIIDTLLGHAREDPAATERFLGLMARETQRMTRLVEDLLSLNRIELNERVLPRDPERVCAVAAETADTLMPVAEAAGVRLVTELPDPGPVVLAERSELAQIFRNLIDNAIKHGGRGTEVTVRMAEDGAPGMTGISVVDQGPGIAREHLPRLTERFYRVSVAGSRARGGTGLGLAIVKHATARHRGRLEIRSAPGEGSTFTVWLPVVPGNRAVRGETPDRAGEALKIPTKPGA